MHFKQETRNIKPGVAGDMQHSFYLNDSMAPIVELQKQKKLQKCFRSQIELT